MNKNPVGKRREAEVAAEHYIREVLGCIRTVRAVKTQWQRQDLFSSDVIGKRKDGTLVCIQVTTGDNKHGCVSTRKRKLEAEVWHRNDRVQLLQLIHEQEGRFKKWYFKVWEYCYPGIMLEEKDWIRKWYRNTTHAVPKEWFKVGKPHNTP